MGCRCVIEIKKHSSGVTQFRNDDTIFIYRHWDSTPEVVITDIVAAYGALRLALKEYASRSADNVCTTNLANFIVAENKLKYVFEPKFEGHSGLCYYYKILLSDAGVMLSVYQEAGQATTKLGNMKKIESIKL